MTFGNSLRLRVIILEAAIAVTGPAAPQTGSRSRTFTRRRDRDALQETWRRRARRYDRDTLPQTVCCDPKHQGLDYLTGIQTSILPVPVIGLKSLP